MGVLNVGTHEHYAVHALWGHDSELDQEGSSCHSFLAAFSYQLQCITNIMWGEVPVHQEALR